MSSLKSDIAQTRAFNRFFTRVIGVVNEGVLKSEHTLAEARIIHETDSNDDARAVTLAEKLDMDTGQLSRTIKRLADNGLLKSQPSHKDGRANLLKLTARGKQKLAELNALSDAAAGELLAPLGEQARAELMRHMRAIQHTLGDDRWGETLKVPTATLRSHRVGEIGWLIHRQAVLYNQEYGWNAAFEALITKIYADFEAEPATSPKGLWVLDYDGEVAGSVFVAPSTEDKSTAQLRMLYVEPWARGSGNGSRLVDMAVEFARENGYRRILLWTQDCLSAARKTYQSAGFELLQEARHTSFGKNLNGQYWQLDFG